MPPSRFDVAASGGMGPCFGEPPLPALPLPGGDDDLFNAAGNGDMSPSCVADISPTFEKPYMREMEKTIEGTRFVAQHMKNKDKFESVSLSRVSLCSFFFLYLSFGVWYPNLRRRCMVLPIPISPGTDYWDFDELSAFVDFSSFLRVVHKWKFVFCMRENVCEYAIFVMMKKFFGIFGNELTNWCRVRNFCLHNKHSPAKQL